MDSTSKGYLGQIVAGACIVLIALFFPLFTVTYNPPGGSAVIAGHRISAFVDVISGWNFADSAAYFRLRPAVEFMFISAGVGLIRLCLPKGTANAVINMLSHIFHHDLVKIANDYFHAFMHIIIAFSWLVVLLLAILIGTPAMPVSGEAGILPAFQVPPYAPAAAQPVTVEVPHLSATIGIGYFILLFGIAIGGLAVFKKVIHIVIALIVILPILYFVDKAIFQQVILFLGV
ncbi:MAG TPA: hypothetical protein VKY19_11035 [Ktedonosporobacter sp.]|jgi:hypothetical protein|nr:hypothetical protein [Ktedonosporobacter sp.]